MTKSFLHAIKKLLRLGVVLTIVAGSTVNSSAQESIPGLCSESCSKHIDVSLDASGYALVDPMMVEEEAFNTECFPLFKKIEVAIVGASSASVEITKRNHSVTTISALVDATLVGQKVAYKLVKTYTDGSKNTCEGTVLIEDTMLPNISCNDLEIKSDENIDPFELDKKYINSIPLASDNCKTVSLIYEDLEMDMDFHEFDFSKKIKRTWTATDAHGNFKNCTSIITIEDKNIKNLPYANTEK